MKLLIICSKKFYSKISVIKDELERKGYTVYLPNCYDNPDTEDEMRALGENKHRDFKAKMFRQSEELIRDMDAVLVLNFDKEQDNLIFKNYIGGATFLEMYDAFRFNKKIYLWNNVPDGMLKDEILGFSPFIINGNIDLIGK